MSHACQYTLLIPASLVTEAAWLAFWTRHHTHICIIKDGHLLRAIISFPRRVIDEYDYSVR